MFDIVRFCTDRRIPFLSGSGHHHCKEGWVQLHCPKCSSGREGWHLGFSLEGGSFNCWRCGSIKLSDAIQSLLRLPNQSDVRTIISAYQKKGPIAHREYVHRPKTIIPPTGLEPLRPRHIQYLTDRGFNVQTLEETWELKATTCLSGAWNWRIVYPVRNRAGMLVAYQGRSISDKVHPKYKLTGDKEMLEDPSNLLYGIHLVYGDTVLVVEGALDVWSVGMGAVAAFGIDWKPAQVLALKEYRRRFILFDPEDKAQLRAQSLAEALSVYQGETEVLAGFRCDPGDLSRRQVAILRKEIGL